MNNFESKNNNSLSRIGRGSQSGRSMIEMLGVLAIIGVLSVGGIAGYSKAMTKYRINKTIEQITLIAGNVRAFFAPQGNYAGVYCNGHDCDATNGCMGHSGVGSNGSPTYANNGCPIIKKAKILPDEMITLDSTGKLITAITNPFGGGVDLYNGGSAGEIMIQYYIGNNTEACIELASQDWTTGDNYYTIAPLNMEDAVTACTTPNVTNILFAVILDVNPSSAYWSDMLSDCAIASGGC